jgi:transketolase
LGLSKLIVLYDDNGITIDGSTALSYTEDVTKRFESYGWDVQSIDGHDPAQIERAISAAQKTKTPSLIRCKTHIGFGAPTKQDSASSHGSPLGAEEIKGARANLGWAHEAFVIPSDILNAWRSMGTRSQAERTAWQKRLDAAPKKQEFVAALEGNVAQQTAPLFAALKTKFAAEKPKLATRQTSGLVLDQLAPALTALIGGSADLTGSVNTKVKSLGVISKDHYDGQYIHYGVREHGMAALMNGLALHGGFIPYSGTFLSFADYCRPAIRLSALMKQRVVYVMTHDSIGLGEDGPTHQPVEHLASLRVIPNLLTLRPCDGVETAECWEIALSKRETPTVLALTRQGLPTLRGDSAENLCAKGAYILADSTGAPKVTIFASGSEVEIAMTAKTKLDADGIATRVVSVPCQELFWAQGGEYIQSLLCNDSLKIAVEAAVRTSWDRFIGSHGAFVGMTGFGESAPAKDLFEHFGITAEAVVKKAKDVLKPHS